jgi:hypothetical protein
MRRSHVIALQAVALVALAVGGVAFAAGLPAVSLGDAGPTPAVLTVTVAQTVTFSNASTHTLTVVSHKGAFSSPALPPGGAFAHVFPKAGAYQYRLKGTGKSSTGRVDVVTVPVPKAVLSLTSSSESIQFGQALVLDGRLTSTPEAVEPVVLQRKTATQKDWIAVQTVNTAVDGSYRVSLRPVEGATYRVTARGGSLTSPRTSVVVRPRVTITSPAKLTRAGHKVTLRVRVQPPTAAYIVDLRRFDRYRRVWKRVATAQVRNGSASVSWTAVAGRSLLRGWLNGHQVVRGYAESFSRQIAIEALAVPTPAVKTKVAKARARCAKKAAGAKKKAAACKSGTQ